MKTALLLVIISVVGVIGEKCFAGVIGPDYIKTSLVVLIDIDGGKLSVKDESNYSFNKWLSVEGSADGRNTMLLHAWPIVVINHGLYQSVPINDR